MGSTPWIPYGLADLGQDCVRLLDSLGIFKAHVVGFSMGGMVAQMFAQQHGRRCASLVLISTCSQQAKVGHVSVVPFWLTHLFAMGRAFDPLANAQQRRKGIEGFWANISGKDGPECQRQIALQEQARGLPDIDTTLRQSMAIMSWIDGPHSAPHSEALHPTLVIHGLHDPLLPVQYAMTLAERAQSQRLIILPTIGHDVLPAGGNELLDALVFHFQKADGDDKGDHAAVAGACEALPTGNGFDLKRSKSLASV